MNNATNTNIFPYLERLLEGEAVEWKTLGEVFHTRNGYTPSKANEEFWTDGTIPWFRMEDIRANGRILYDSALHITPQAVKRNGLFKANSIILATSATVGEHALLLQDSLTNQRFTNFEIKDNLKEQLLPKFVFYYFFLIDEWCKLHLVIGNFPSVDVQQLINIPFPIPPLRVQARIVEILDKFTQLEKELEAELEARKKQYAYYRDQLLNFSQYPPLNVNIEWKTLGEVAEFKRGQTIIQKTAPTGVYPVISGGQQPAYYIDKYNRTGQTITVAGSGAYAGFVMFWDEPIFVSDAFSIKTDEEVVLPRYVFHFLLNKQSSIFNLKRGAGVPHVYAKDLAAFSIPLPPLSEQRRIVDILDRFDTLTNSISEGLPKEIALRRKQYEFYRDALLSFPRPEATA